MTPYQVADLFFFSVVARHGSFSRAAEELSISQAAVSQRIRQFEARLGRSLFTRHQRGIALTALGTQLAAAVSDPFNEIERQVDALMEPLSRQSVTLSCSPSMALGWLLPRIGAFSLRQPNIELRIKAEYTTPEAHSLAAAQTDIILRYEPDIERAAFDCENIAEEPIFPVASPMLASQYADRSKSSDLLTTEPLFHDEESWEGASKTYEWDKWLDHFGVPRDTNSNCKFFNMAYMAFTAAAGGAGVAMGRAIASLDQLRSQSLVPAGPVLEASGLFYRLLRPRRMAQRDASITVCRWLQSEMEQSLRDFRTIV